MSIKQEWQKQWRQALGEPTDSMPDIRDDYALHFDIWNLSDEKLEECFSIFPHGDRILQRVNEVRRTHPQSTIIDDKKLLTQLDQLNKDIVRVLQKFGDEELIRLNEEKATAKKRSVYRGKESLRHDVFKNADSPTLLLDDELCEIIEQHCGEQGYEAFLFLSEPLYQLSGCYYTVAHWIAWAMVESEYDADPYQEAFNLYKIKAQAGWSNDEQFIYIAN